MGDAGAVSGGETGIGALSARWFAVLITVNLQTSFMHPPFGIALYNLRSVAPSSVRTPDIYWGAVPFLAIQLLMVIILIAAPGIVLKYDPASDAPRAAGVPFARGLRAA